MTYLGLNWSSKSSCTQRKGRTGRCNEGNYFIMVNEEFYHNLNEGSDPEILRTPLDKLILKVNTINESIEAMKNNNHKE